MTMETQFLTGFEKNLSINLKSVDPDPMFVQKLGNRLTRPNAIKVEYRRNGLFAGVVIAFGLVFGVIVILLHRR